jgi:error-prone DNA polymerase
MPYAELHCKTNFSFLEGASHADELVLRAAELGYAALAVTDRQSLAGIVRAHGPAKEIGLKLLIGAEMHPIDAPPVVLWATDRASYGRLSRLITVGRRRAPKGQCQVTLADIAQHAEGLLAGVMPVQHAEPCRVGPAEIAPAISAPAHHEPRVHSGGPALAGASLSHPTATTAALRAYRDIFGDRGYLLAELFRGPDDVRLLEELKQLSRQTQLPLVAAGDVHYHAPARMPLFEVLTAVRLGTTVDRIEAARFPNAQRHLRPIEEIAAAFAAAPDALRRTLEIAGRCTFSLDELKYEYPEELAPEGFTPMEYLSHLAWKGAHKRYPQGIPDKVRRLLEHELALIRELKYEAFFLTVWDAVRFARQRGILCQGRGSAANSAVCYCLGVTSVDPDRTDLLFERFVSKERNEAPDIDVDFEHERREEVLQYLYEKYGRERAGLTAVVITYRMRSAVRDVGKALGLSLDRVDALAKQVEGYSRDERFPQRCAQVGIDPSSPLGRRLVHLVNELLGFPRHLSQHVGGMVITRGPLCELSPIENAAMEGRTVIQWDKDDLDELGILKVDCLCLGMLTAIRKCFELVKRHYGREVTLASVPAEDGRVYDMICRADTMGVFQIESRAQMSMLPRLKPRCFYDLVIEVAIVRPGPIQGDMVHPYLRRRAGEPLPPYPTPEIEAVLAKTLGVPLFQEQAMRLAVVAAGFTPGEADQLRRAMGAWRRPGLIDQFRVKLMEGMKAKGLSDEFAEQVFHQIRGFGEYGFPESHAASFALLVYVSAWLKCYYPAAFCAALLNSQPMGFYAPAQLLRDAWQHGVKILPVDVNESQWDSTLEGSGVEVQGSEDSGFGIEDLGFESGKIPNPKSQISNQFSIRLGFRLLTGIPEAAVKTIVAARAAGRFTSLNDFVRRTRLSRAIVSRLAEADVFSSLALDRRSALWQSLAIERQKTEMPLLAGLADDEPEAKLPRLSLIEQVFADYRTAGLSLKAHPVAFFRRELAVAGVKPAEELERIDDGRRVKVAGMVILRQRPNTAKGITFVTIEDETGVANLVVKQPIWERYYTTARTSSAWIVHGTLQKKDSVIHVVASRIEDFSERLGKLAVKSRDFR